jgi:hypothetical protein
VILILLDCFKFFDYLHTRTLDILVYLQKENQKLYGFLNGDQIQEITMKVTDSMT